MTDISPLAWATILAPSQHWRECYPIVAGEARRVLKTLGPDQSISTAHLVDQFLPESVIRGAEQVDARQRMFRALMALAVHDLSDCASRGPEERNSFGVMRRWNWHTPTEPNPDAKLPGRRTCPHCGGPLND